MLQGARGPPPDVERRRFRSLPKHPSRRPLRGLLEDEGVWDCFDLQVRLRGADHESDAPAVHPLVVRVTHWINAGAVAIMIGSGFEIHNAHPILPFAVPSFLTIGGWLGGATQWHFAAMWVLVLNGAVYLAYGLASKRLARNCCDPAAEVLRT